MFARLAFLIALCLGLAVAPVRSIANCETANVGSSCQGCCATPDTACCELAGASSNPSAPAKIAPASPDAKQLVFRSLNLLGVAPTIAIEPPAVHRLHSARIPAQPVVFQTCIRLL